MKESDTKFDFFFRILTIMMHSLRFSQRPPLCLAPPPPDVDGESDPDDQDRRQQDHRDLHRGVVVQPVGKAHGCVGKMIKRKRDYLTGPETAKFSARRRKFSTQVILRRKNIT